MLERLHKILARAGVAALRPAEDMILAGRVTVNGRIVRELGARADAATDAIAVDGQVIDVPEPTDPHHYYVLHKPVGVISTAHDPEGRPTVVQLVPAEARVFPVGRLDADSEGLLVLTDDGDLAYRLTHPRFEVEKEYRVLLDQPLSVEAMREWRNGVVLPIGDVTARAWVERLERTPDGDWIRVVLHEGKKREIREVARVLGYDVRRLIRVREGPITLGDLPVGAWRPLTAAEIEGLRRYTQHIPSREAEQQVREFPMSEEESRPRRLRVVRSIRRPAIDEASAETSPAAPTRARVYDRPAADATTSTAAAAQTPRPEVPPAAARRTRFDGRPLDDGNERTQRPERPQGPFGRPQRPGGDNDRPFEQRDAPRNFDRPRQAEGNQSFDQRGPAGRGFDNNRGFDQRPPRDAGGDRGFDRRPEGRNFAGNNRPFDRRPPEDGPNRSFGPRDGNNFDRPQRDGNANFRQPPRDGASNRGFGGPRQGEGNDRPFDRRPDGPPRGPNRPFDRRPPDGRGFGGPRRDEGNDRPFDRRDSGQRPDDRPRGFDGPRRDDQPSGFGGPRRPDNRGFGGPRQNDDRPRGFGGPRNDDRPGGFGGPRRDERPGGFGGPRRDDDRPRGFGPPRRDDDNRGFPPRDPNQRDERPGGFGGSRRDDDRPRSFGPRRPDDRPRGFSPRRPDDRPRGFGPPRRDDRPGGFGGPRQGGDDRPRGFGGPRQDGDNRPRGFGGPPQGGNERPRGFGGPRRDDERPRGPNDRGSASQGRPGGSFGGPSRGGRPGGPRSGGGQQGGGGPRRSGPPRGGPGGRKKR